MFIRKNLSVLLKINFEPLSTLHLKSLAVVISSQQVKN